MAGAQVSSVLAGWPAPWRVAAVLTGVLPVQGALHGRRPYQYRLCSGPALVGVVLAAAFTVYQCSWLTPQALAKHSIKHFLLTVLFELTIAVTWSVTEWLFVERAGKIPKMFSKAEEVLTSNGHLIRQHFLKRRLTHFMLALSPAWVVANNGLSLYNSGNVLHLGNNFLPPYLQQHNENCKRSTEDHSTVPERASDAAVL